MAKLNGVTTVSERIQYNGAEYVKSDEAAVVGDIVRCEDSDCSYLTYGAFYEIVDRHGCVSVIDDTNDDIQGFPKNPQRRTLFKRVESVAAPTPQYREVKRKANVGERIRIVDAKYTSGRYSNGDEVTVDRVTDSGGAEFTTQKGEAAFAYLSEYVVLEAEESAAYEPQVGDKVRSHKYPETLHTLVKRLPQHDGRYGKAWDITPGSWLGENQFFIVERAAEAAKPVEDPRLKVGEYAKVIGGNNYQTEIGDIVVIRSIDGDGDYRVNDLNGKELRGHKKARNVIRATDAEVAEAKRKAEQARKEAEEAAAKAAETAKWAAIGRKVGEFKAGDIVKTVEIPSGITNGHPYGVVGVVEYNTVVRTPRNGNPSVKYNGECLHNNCELIAPVESLFSR